MNCEIPHSGDIYSDSLDIPPSDFYDPSFSDDLEALHAQEVDIAIEKKRQGIVIQHRSWSLAEAFRSDDDRPFAIPSSQAVHTRLHSVKDKRPTLSAIPPSSPPEIAMPFISSPPTYSSNPTNPPPRQSDKDLAGRQRSPLHHVDHNAAQHARNAFLEDSDSDDDAEEAMREQMEFEKRPSQHVAENVQTRQADEPAPVPCSGTDSTSLPTKPATQSLGSSMFAQRAAIAPPVFTAPTTRTSTTLSIRTSSGKVFSTRKSKTVQSLSYEQTIAARSKVVAGKAQRSYYGIDIHNLITDAKAEAKIAAAQAESRPAPVAVPSVELPEPGQRQRRTLMWTEKYRARKFTELVGDDRTHRTVMHWLKRWDDIVFPGSAKPKSKKNREQQTEERPHRKILLLTGPPGLGKTTLAHVCARQAGYEVQEINASDERSSNVVKGRIRDMAGTENVKNGFDTKTATGKISKAARPVCVVIDEVDGVVGGSSGGGEGGFIKALIDLVHLDQRNSSKIHSQQNATKKKKGDNFRLLRPLILICNDVYHPALRPLRQNTIAEIIHVRKPGISNVITRMQGIFDKEQIPFDTDGVRRLCEAAWGITSKKEGGTGSSSTSEGDIRGILVVGEWVASKIRATADPAAKSMQRLTRRWIEQTVLADLSHGGGSARGLGRGGPKEVVERVFKEGAGFAKAALVAANPTTTTSISGVKGVAEAQKRQTIARLAEMISTSDSSDRIMTDCFTAYPDQPFQDDTFLSKPTQAYDWLHFSDKLSSQVFGSSEWELAPYLSTPILAFHNLFATPTQSRFAVGATYNKDGDVDGADSEPLPFSGPQASFQAHEAQKQTSALLDSLRTSLALPLTRMYSSPADLAVEFIPYLSRLLNPQISPVLVGGSGTDKATASVRKASEKVLVSRSVNAMLASGVRFERSRVEFDGPSSGPPQSGGWIYRMEPALDEASSFPTMDSAGASSGGKGKETVRFAVRQVLEQEFSREQKRQAELARKSRGGILDSDGFSSSAPAPAAIVAGEVSKKKLKRDFFGRVIETWTHEQEAEEVAREKEGGEESKGKRRKVTEEAGGDEGRIWITFHEGFSNAVRKPISLRELMAGF